MNKSENLPDYSANHPANYSPNHSETNLITKQEHLTNIINNFVIDNNNIYINRSLKFLINFLLTYCFINLVIYYNFSLNKNEVILLICTFSSILLFILDSNFPYCSLKL